jgi:hypothetical protein
MKMKSHENFPGGGVTGKRREKIRWPPTLYMWGAVSWLKMVGLKLSIFLLVLL